ncbi:hypothetical protein DFJ74DRAFT_772963 [Hyaloraphidium curvatum]|nr:hypothetical protein DFJ74DRAFT_772963 [Hyaloraphidium curvatum]
MGDSGGSAWAEEPLAFDLDAILASANGPLYDGDGDDFGSFPDPRGDNYDYAPPEPQRAQLSDGGRPAAGGGRAGGGAGGKGARAPQAAKAAELVARGEGPPLRRACNFCTKRRRKCDGQTPVCGTCRARNGECIYDVNRKKLVRDSPWHELVKDGTATAVRQALASDGVPFAPPQRSPDDPQPPKKKKQAAAKPAKQARQQSPPQEPPRRPSPPQQAGRQQSPSMQAPWLGPPLPPSQPGSFPFPGFDLADRSFSTNSSASYEGRKQPAMTPAIALQRLGAFFPNHPSNAATATFPPSLSSSTASASSASSAYGRERAPFAAALASATAPLIVSPTIEASSRLPDPLMANPPSRPRTDAARLSVVPDGASYGVVGNMAADPRLQAPRASQRQLLQPAPEAVPDVDSLLDYVQKVLQLQQQQQQEAIFQQLQQEAMTEEGLKRAFIRDIVPCIPRHLRAWIFGRLQADSEFSEYFVDLSVPARRFPGPHVLVPLLSACKRLIVRHVTLPAFLPSLVHVILFSTVLCMMAADPNGEQEPLGADEGGDRSNWTPLSFPLAAKEVHALLRVCVGMSKRMGMNKEPVGRANVADEVVEKTIKESRIITSEVDIGAGILFMDGAGASVSADRMNLTRRLWWTQYMTDRVLAFLEFRRTFIDDADCSIYPPHLAKDAVDAASPRSPNSQNGSSSSHDLGSLDTSDFESIAPDFYLRGFSLLGRVINYRVSCRMYRIDPLSDDDPGRRALADDLDLFRRALPGISRAFERPHSKPSTVEYYRSVVTSLPRSALEIFANALLLHNAATVLLAAPASDATPEALARWSGTAHADKMAEAAGRSANITTNMLWSDVFVADGHSLPVVGFGQVAAFQAAMALVTLLVAKQTKARGTPNAFAAESGFRPPLRTLALYLLAPNGQSSPRFDADLDAAVRVHARGLEGLMNAFELFRLGSAGWMAERAAAVAAEVAEGRRLPCPIEEIGKGWLKGSW